MYIDPETQESFDLSHLNSFQTQFEVLINKEKLMIDTKIIFSNHCYTKKQETIGNQTIIFKEKRKGGAVENRVFCRQRWEFSKLLPEIIKELGYKICLQGNDHSLFYRHEKKGDSLMSLYEGWYICMKWDYKVNCNPSLEIWVRSVHFRTNRPHDVRGSPTKFCILLSRYLKSKLHKDKNP